MRLTLRLLGALAVIVVIMFATDSYAHHGQYYVLDGFGGVHAGGGAAAPPAGIPYFGFDIAKDIAYVPAASGDGIMVLDGFGGVHTAGLSVAFPTPYFGFDVARAIAYRNIPPRAAGSAATDLVSLKTASATFTVLDSVSITAPDDGFLLVSGSALVACDTGLATDDVVGQMMINVDATTTPAELINQGYATFPDCTAAAGGTVIANNNQSITHLFPVTAGAHTVYILGRKHDGTAAPAGIRILGRSITALFVDHGATGQSAPMSGGGGPNDLRPRR